MIVSDTIDALVVARRVLDQPSRFRVTDNEVLAMAGCLIGPDQQIDRLEAGPTTNARLAAAIASFIRHHTADVQAAPEENFTRLKTVFEEEFPL